jgi:hypothetical protein
MPAKPTKLAQNQASETNVVSPGRPYKRLGPLSMVLLSVSIILALGAVFYTSSPEVIRHPLPEHYHFRMQVLVNGQAENFSAKKYQKEYDKGQCSNLLSEDPIHFHDGKDQFVHVHWEGMTGGLVLKNYGWNYIGGMDGTLGYSLDKMWQPKRIKAYGKILPSVPQNAEYFIYVGDEHGYKEKSLVDFLNQDLERFFEKRSNYPGSQLNKQKRDNVVMQLLFPKVSAHANENHDSSLSEEDLQRINNLIGSVVIFVQKDAPTQTQITARFHDLEPLSDSTCGG